MDIGARAARVGPEGIRPAPRTPPSGTLPVSAAPGAQKQGMIDMVKFGVAQPVTRKEDLRLLTGGGRYVDDTAPEGAVWVQFLRSPVAHARLTKVDASAARETEGVLAVFTAADLEGKLRNAMDAGVVQNRDGSSGAAPTRPILAAEKVTHVGEAIAAVRPS